jgi:peptidoglycan/xylan/chitin deacetylase (PgdA/CDA1 family)
MGSMKKAIIGASVASLALAHPQHSKRGALPIDGTIYTSCTETGVVALTFDDGPYIYTQSIVDQLTAAGHRVSFFQNGQNYDSIYNYNSTLQSMIAGGHQVCSHTWDHADLATLDAAGITNEMMELEAAHLAILGKAPTYMRPPYLSTNDLVISTLTGLGYKIIEVDIDTQDWAEGPIGLIDLSIQWYEGNQTAGGTLSLNHDPYQATADTFVPAIIAYLAGKNLKSVPVGECLGDDPANWYRGGSTPSSSVSPSGSPTASPSPSGPAGNGTSPGSPTSSGKGAPGTSTFPSGLSKPTGKGKPVCGGDTEPGHGANSGRGSIPGHQGTGNNGWTNSSSPGAPGKGAPGWSPTNSSTTAKPTYYSNGASGLTVSSILVGIAALAFLL